MNNLNHLIKTKLKLQDNSVVYPASKWTIFSNEIRESLTIIQPDAVYHFNKQPFILFFDFTKLENKKRESTIHRQVWCFDKAPVMFLIFDDEVKIYNAFHYQKQYDSLERLDISNYEEQFSFWNLQSGNTWRWLQDTFYNRNTKKYRVDQRLFDNIKKTRKKLTEDIKPGLEGKFANILILRLIFIRYLIDRNVKIDEQFITGNTLAERKDCLNKLIGNKEALNNFFLHLEDRFNGNLFEKQNTEIAQTHLQELSNMFSAYNNQLFLFDVFDFSIISVETISGIYESVIDPKKRKKNSAVYTPPFLVDYILSQTVDVFLDDKNECRILDPACGSGVFLVQAYRRMVEKNKDEKGKISDERLIALIKQNLFGIDKDPNALNVTAFSLYIALLDYKQPPEIKDFKLPPLFNSNLFKADFLDLDEDAPFNSVAVFKNRQFDFILGNPPWGSKDDNKHLEYIKEHQVPVARNEISQTFLARSKDFANKHTQCALIVTSKAFYNLRAKNFKKYFLNKFYIHQILDLSAVRRLIFPEKNNPAMIVFYYYAFGQNTEENIIRHLSIKQNIFLKYFNTLVIERQDQKEILQKHFINYEWLFKVALYGNTIDFHLLKRILDYKSSILKQINTNTSIIRGDGILPGTPKEYFLFLKDMPIIENEQIKKFYTSVNTNQKLKSEDTFLESGRTLKLFDGHHILLKSQTENESDLVVSYIDTPSVFKHDVFGITTKTELDELKLLYGVMISSLYTYYQYMMSSAWGIATRPAIRLPEYLSFPYREIKDKEVFINLINQLIDYYKTNYLQGIKFNNISPPTKLLNQINTIVNKAYKINNLEKDLIDYVLDVSRYQFQESKLHKLIRPPDEDELKRYAEVFYNHFSPVYNDENERLQIDIYRMPYFIAMLFKIVPSPSTNEQIIIRHDETEKAFFQLIAQSFSMYEESDRIFIQKDVKGFEEDFFYIIKPNEYKCWHRAIAHYDLAEFSEAIMKAEIKQANKQLNDE